MLRFTTLMARQAALYGVVALFQGFPIAALATPFDYAVFQYDKGMATEAVRRFAAQAELGIAAAQRNLGVIYLTGRGVSQDRVKGYAWLSVAAANGDPDAERLVIKARQAIPAADRDSAEETARDHVSRFQRQAVFKRLAPSLNPARTRPIQPDIRWDEVDDRAEPRWPWAMRRQQMHGSTVIGYSVPSHGHPRDYYIIAESDRTFSEALAGALPKWVLPTRGPRPVRHHSHYLFWLAPVGQKRPLPLSDAQAENLQQLADGAARGDLSSMYRYAWMTQLVPINEYRESPARTLGLLYEAAKLGATAAYADIARKLQFGEGCDPDPSKADSWRQLAAHAGDAESLRWLADDALAAGGQGEFLHLLNAAARTNRPTDIARLAWIFATVDQHELRDPSKAMTMLEGIKSTYLDEVAWLEIRAAAYAALGQFGRARRSQRAAIREAGTHGLPTERPEQRLAIYSEDRSLSLDITQTPF